jgi:phosphoserine aminotransferase
MPKTYFTPGPAELYPSVGQHVQTALTEQLGSISHRSQKFRDIYKFTASQLRILMNIPETHAILFLGSANEIWERLLMSCVEHESYHLVNGSFSRKFYDFSLELHKYAHKFEKPFGQGFSHDDFVKPATEKALGKKNARDDDHKVRIADYAELVCLTANETSSGVQMPVVDIHQLKRSHPDKLFCVDMVSSAPHPNIDYKLIDSAFFSVQKSFGLPAGLGVWIVNEKCLDKAERLRQYEGLTTGTYHSLPTLWQNYRKFETPETPNVWSIFLLGKVAEDMNYKGIDTIRKETDQKAKLLYDFAEKSPDFEIFVQNPAHRSQTVVVLNTPKPTQIIEQLKTKDIVLGSGYGTFKDQQIRIANFPAVSVAQVEKLIFELKNL